MNKWIDRLQAFHNALHAGEELANAQVWARGGNSAALLVIIVQSIAIIAKSFGFDPGWGGVDVHEVANGLSLIGTAIVAIMHTVASKHVGFSKRDNP